MNVNTACFWQRAFLITVACLAAAIEAGAATYETVEDFGSNPGQLKMLRYVPNDLPTDRPMVVLLHGCTQDGATYADQTGWRGLADQWKFALLIPEQRRSNNLMKCFNWFAEDDIARDKGEALSIKQMIDKMTADTRIDRSQIYITGLSAGGAMAVVMLATYPDQFAGGAVIAGLPYKCATGLLDARGCMNPGKDLTPSQWGDRVRNATSHSGAWPTISIWHGKNDAVVSPLNATELVDQWTNLHGIDQQADITEVVDGHPHHVYADANGNPLVQTYLIEEMEHGAPIAAKEHADSGENLPPCGSAGPYLLEAGICSTHHIAQSWGLNPMSSQTDSRRATSGQ